MPRFAFTTPSLAWSLLRLVLLTTSLLGGLLLAWGWASHATGLGSVPGWHHSEWLWLLAGTYGFMVVQGIRVCRRAGLRRSVAGLLLSAWQVLPDGQLSTSVTRFSPE